MYEAKKPPNLHLLELAFVYEREPAVWGRVGPTRCCQPKYPEVANFLVYLPHT